MKNASFIFMNLHYYCRRGGAGGVTELLNHGLRKRAKAMTEMKMAGIDAHAGGGVCRGSSDDKSTS